MNCTCQFCGQKLEAISPAQSEYVSGKTFRLPFTDICITIYHDKPTVQYDCLECLQAKREQHEQQNYDAGYEAALTKVYNGEIEL